MDVFIEESLVRIIAGFDRGAFCRIGDGTIDIKVVGSFSDGKQFYGIDTVKITKNYLKHVAALASQWLSSGCCPPDWCDGLDLDQSSTVNFVDLAMFDDCCLQVIED